MSTLAIVLIVVLLLLIIVLPLCFSTFIGCYFLKMLKKNKNDLFTGPKMDLSFYENSPHKKAAKIGREYLDANVCKEISIVSSSNIKLCGYYYPAPKGKHKKFLLAMHGFKSAARMEYAPYAKFYHSLGFDLVLVNQRAHNNSEGKYCTMGVNERFDCLDWINYIIKSHGEDCSILLHGVSMGAATVCSVAGENLPPQVIGIVSDCAYSSIRDELNFQMKKATKLNTNAIINICNSFAKMFAKFNIDDVTPEKQVAKAKVPILFVHGKNDCIVPCDFCNRLYNVCSSKKQKLIIPKANHVESIAVNKELYEKTIKEFFKI